MGIRHLVNYGYEHKSADMTDFNMFMKANIKSECSLFTWKS